MQIKLELNRNHLNKLFIFSFQFDLSFLVEDNKNGSSILFPQFTVCACENGTCVKQATSVEQTNLVFMQHEVLDCKCDIGFIGEFCDRVRDFCQTQSGSPCHPLTNCTNSPNNFVCGDCPTGYSGNGFNCTGKTKRNVECCSNKSINLGTVP